LMMMNGCRSGSVPIRPNPFGPDPEQPPVMLLCIYDLWESLVFLTTSDSFLNQLAYSLSFLFRTSFVAWHLVAC
jgi:hypothetical protein